jgi:hypothetical protein
MKTLFTLITLSFCIVSNAQNFVWAKTFGGSSSDIGKIIKIDNSGNVITAGTFNGTADFDPGPGTFTMTSAGYEDVYITKLTSTGSFVWAIRFGNSTGNSPGTGENVRDLAIDASGNIYAIGNFSSTVDFNPGAATNTITSAGIYDAYILKLNSSGTYMWAKTISGTSQEIGFGIDVDNTGVYTTGYSSTGADFDPSATTYTVTNAGGADLFVAKYDLNGNYIWAQGMGGTNIDIGTSVKVHPTNGRVYTTGYFGGTADFSPGTSGPPLIVSAGNSDIFISSLDATTGAYAGQAAMGGTGNDIGLDLEIDGSGNIYTTGSFNGSCDFDPGAAPGFLTSLGNSDAFVSKLTPALSYLWAKQVEGAGADEGENIVIDAMGNSYSTGYFSTSADFDPTTSTYTLSNNGQQGYVWKLNSAGYLVWARNFASSSPSSVIGNGIALDSYANIYTTGYYNYTCDFDQGLGTNTLTAVGGLDAFVCKLGCTLPQTVTTSAPLNLPLCIGTSTSIPIALTSTPEANVTYYWSTVGATGVSLSLTSGTATSVSFTASTSFSIIVTGTNVCGTTSTYASSVIVNPLPVLTTTIVPASGIICQGDNAKFTTGGALTYTWNPSYYTNGTFYNFPSSGVFTVTATDANTCVNKQTVSLTVIPNYTISATGKYLACLNKPNTLTATGANTYTWMPGAIVSPTINTGTLAATAANTQFTITSQDANGCYANTTFAMNLVIPQTPSICEVTVDSASVYNNIIWDKSAYNNVDSFIVYREVSTGIYKRIGAQYKTVTALFVDTARSVGPANGDPNATSYRYKLQLRDTCGNYSVLSPYHNSIYFITSTPGTYVCNTYSVELQALTPVSSFDLMRDDLSTGTWTYVTSSAGTQNSLNDINASAYPSGRWRVYANGFICDPTLKYAPNQQVNKAKSNVKNNLNGPPSGIINLLANSFVMAPNPVNSELTVSFTDDVKTKTTILITDVLGKQIYKTDMTNGSKLAISVADINSGIYFLTIEQGNAKVVKKFVKE